MAIGQRYSLYTSSWAKCNEVERSHSFACKQAKVNVSQIHRYEIFILNGALENLHSDYI